MSFTRYLIKKVVEAVFTIYIGVTVAFFLFRLLPGDPTAIYMDIRLTPEAKQALLETFGLDKPLLEQYFIFLGNILQNNWGISFVYQGTPVSKLIFGPMLFNTLILMGTSMFLGAILSTLIGIYSGWRRNSRFDKATIFVSYMAASSPVFWVGLLILLVFSRYLRLIPISGTLSTDVIGKDFLSVALDYLWHMAGPLMTLIVFFIPLYLLYVRNHVVNLLGEDFITTLLAKGLPSKVILFKHIMRYVLVTVVTLLAVQSPLLISGAIITETVFGWNGIGLLLYKSVLASDYPVIQGVFVLTIIVVVVANLMADIVYGILDPRIRRRMAE